MSQKSHKKKNNNTQLVLIKQSFFIACFSGKSFGNTNIVSNSYDTGK